MSQHPNKRSIPSLPVNRTGPKGAAPGFCPRLDLPRYKVILLKDTHYDLVQVVQAIMDLTHLCRAEATYKMWQAYYCGRSVLLTTYRERAELYVEQFAQKGLQVTLEPA
jgi:ATP-dependent Clp protease adapter protein ClpS